MSINKMLITCFVMLTTACASDAFITHNGNMPTNERIAKIEVGSSRDDVLKELGAPSNVVSFDKNTWIYMSSDVKKVAFFEPEEIGRDVLTIRFNNHDEVMDISRMSKANGVEVVMSEEKTETLGQEPGWLQKTFGTLGSYNPFPGGAPM